jgi:hypothetical protein
MSNRAPNLATQIKAARALIIANRAIVPLLRHLLTLTILKGKWSRAGAGARLIEAFELILRDAEKQMGMSHYRGRAS